MKYRVLKECVLDHIYREVGESYETDRKYDYIDECIKHGFLEPIRALKTVDDLKDGDVYFDINSAKMIGRGYYCSYNQAIKAQREVGDIFLTKEDAKKELARRKARVILLRDTKGFKPDWENTSALDNKWVYTVYYSHRENILQTNGYAINRFPCDIWFATEADAEASIKAHPNEWKTYLGVEA